MKNVEYADTNKKSVFRFLFSEIWSFSYSKLVHFRLILSTKSTITKKKNQKMIFHSLQHIAHLLLKLRPFLKGRGGGVLHILSKEITIISIKLSKLYQRPNCQIYLYANSPANVKLYKVNLGVF